ncbi:ubiquitin carboxyl-terminal hydrolase 25-like isoform X2 [Ptychodera flava]|uniref:ubiquitin carboxyl-terminal hydrolase 25-like isoform X2 n=1 Tax=Ptychodera flava TaxID=63121 RepID=UPI00396A1A35
MSAMTVEQNILQQHAIQNQEQIINQLKEITGISDVQALQNAVTASQGDVNEAVSMLTQDAGSAEGANPQVVPTSQPSTTTTVATATPTTAEPYGPKTKSQATGVIDLTNEGDDKSDLQRAIALSLQESGPSHIGVSAEEQDISRALEESLAETKHGAKRKRGEGWFTDPLNPHERRRDNGWPVGLKNVGNTCWFSAVIQSLFHLPVFRQLVLMFRAPQPDVKNASTAENTIESRNLIFMNELRALFALMVGTKRKYVDPIRSVEILKAAFSSNSSEQQDVSEFTHKLLEWLEDAFKLDTSRHNKTSNGCSSDSDTEQSNPMLELFYGQFRAEGINEGKVFSNQETFGQYPLQVNGFNDLHESLEAATAKVEIETVNSDSATQSGQEHWFTRLPPVLTFELSRFQFNQQIGRPEKIHNKLTFPQMIYMDRYMECNKNITRMRREQIKKLREQLQGLRGRLERFLNYGSGAKRFPLMDVLQYALEFASSRSPVLSPESQCHSNPSTPIKASPGNTEDVEMSTPPRASLDVSMNSISPGSSPSKIPLPDIALPTVPMSPAGGDGRTGEGTPSPKHVTDGELKVLQGCLRRWRTEVESDVRDLQDNIRQLNQQIDVMYDEDELKKFPYLLHAVLVHEGQASAGHYWAYIRDHRHNKWLKFNDISVMEVSWEELQRESVGGSGNASAYCLMYVDENKSELFAEHMDGETGHMKLSLDSLAEDLRQLVIEDNTRFEKEMADWDAEQIRKAATMDEVTIVSEQRSSTTSTHTATSAGQAQIVPSSPSSPAAASEAPPASPPASCVGLETEHNRITYERSTLAIERVKSVYLKSGADEALTEAYQDELRRLQSIAGQFDQSYPKQDFRLKSGVIFFLKNNAPSFVIERTIYEQFAFKGLTFDNSCKSIKKAAMKKMDSMVLSPEDMEKYKRWHEDYLSFRKAVSLLVLGLESYHNKENYLEALPYFVYAHKFNASLRLEEKYYSVDDRLISVYRRECLLQLNDQCASSFESDDEREADEALKTVEEYVVPCLGILSSSKYAEDNSAAEDIRDRWYSFLGQEINASLQEKFQDFLPKLIDVSADACTLKTPTMSRLRKSHDLGERYAEVMEVVLQSGVYNPNGKPSTS